MALASCFTIFQLDQPNQPKPTQHLPLGVGSGVGMYADLRYLLTDVPPQSNLPDNVFPQGEPWLQKETQKRVFLVENPFIHVRKGPHKVSWPLPQKSRAVVSVKNPAYEKAFATSFN